MIEDKFSSKAIQALTQAAEALNEISQQLKDRKKDFDATNLPVAEAVTHITACLDRDAEYLSKLAEICKGQPTDAIFIKRVGNG